MPPHLGKPRTGRIASVHNHLVTIGMPVWNGADVMGRALDSLLAQSWADLEIVISDNASTDGTRDLAAEYVRRDPRVRYIRQAHNIGAQANFEFLLGVARGEYFMWAAVDDVWDRQFVEELRQELERHRDANVAMSAVERLWTDGTLCDVVGWQGDGDPTKLSHLSLGVKVAGGKPYHLFIYGLYRTRFLIDAFIGLPSVIAIDRLFVCQNALATKFRYVDKVLHRRQVTKVSLTQRYQNDDLGRAWTKPFSEWKLVFAGGRFLARSKVIPWTRKIYLPIILTPFVKRAIIGTAVRIVRRARMITKGGTDFPK
jgi:glycosyltransferase involved in cell wall biosynthesis